MKQYAKHIGTLLIITSLFLFGVYAYPIVKAYLITKPVQLPEVPYEEFVLTIPTIKAQSLVIENVDPWDERIYDIALENGIAHAKGTGLPGESKTVYLFAHSSGYPWEQYANNTVFLRLGELREGDTILIDRNGKRFSYKVTMKKEVWPNETRYLEDIASDQLILQTCTPLGTTFKRLLVFAEPVRNELVKSKY